MLVIPITIFHIAAGNYSSLSGNENEYNILSENLQEKAVNVIEGCVSEKKLKVDTINWLSDRLEVTVAIDTDVNSDVTAFSDSPSIDSLSQIHRSIYDSFELDNQLKNIPLQYEILVASKGVGDSLFYDRDFITFKGFPVIVYTKELYKKKTIFEGNLVNRDEEFVNLSLKGRPLKIPRVIIDSINFPKAKYEDEDEEIKKLSP